MEIISEISVKIEIDTNKRRITKRLFLDDFDGNYDEFIEASKNLIETEITQITEYTS